MEGKKDFHHPYTPYDIQETFMSTVYQTLEDSKVGILESPTGTARDPISPSATENGSTSLICGSVTWLRDHKGKEFEDGLDWDQADSNEPQWVLDQAKFRRRREMLRQREDMEVRLAKIRAREKAQKERYQKGSHNFKKRKMDSNLQVGDDDEEQYVLDDYESDSEKSGETQALNGVYSAATLQLMEQLGMMKSTKEQEIEEKDEIKIFYCSRTHSQLTQFINELRRVHFPPAIPSESPEDEAVENLKHVTLGSRKNLCINPSIAKLNSLKAINERCAELQQSGTAQEHKCVFLPSQENQTLVNEFRDHSLAVLRDIEDMGTLGKNIGICPYYASRTAVKSAEIVTLPYPLLLQKSARDALGLSLKGHVVIIDEAHNLMDAIAGIHSVEVTLGELKRARAQIGVYLQKFKNKLKGKNRVYIAQAIRVIDSISAYLESRLAIQGKSDGIASEQEILSGKGADQINLHKLARYLQESKLARKIEGYTTHIANSTHQSQLFKSSNQPPSKPELSTPVLHSINSMLSALTHPSKEGRFFFTKSQDPHTPDAITLRFLLLDPSMHFQEIVSEARTVILAGGTMSPMSDYTSHLFPYLPSTSITTLSCGHVIPKENLVAWNLSKGPSGQEFEFTFKNRGNHAMVDELGRALLNVCTVVPDGVVVFFPSYSYLSEIVKRWEVTSKSGEPSLWQRLGSKKALFQESKDASVDTVLTEYAKAIDTGHGGLLLSVVGGKMSEGINFSDSLGRCVVIVGLPFPNILSAEWKAKIEYIETSTVERLEAEAGLVDEASRSAGRQERISKGKEQGREYYENACMRAVNQSVGRAIRHRNDYASILMIDKRFGNERIKGKLPGWIRDGLTADAGERSFGQLMGTLSSFYRRKKP